MLRRLLIQFIVLALRGATPVAVGFLPLGEAVEGESQLDMKNPLKTFNFPSQKPLNSVLGGHNVIYRHKVKRWTGALTGHNTDKLYASQSNPVCAVRIRNIWMNASPHHFHPRVLVKYGLISWCLAETIFMIYIWHHWSHKFWVVMSENCIIRMIAIETSQCHLFHLQGRRVQSACFMWFCCPGFWQREKFIERCIP